MRTGAGGASDVGRVRNANQDSWLITDRLWAVADGMGGHQGGEVASQVTIEVLADRFDEFTADALVAAAQAANSAVHERASEHAELRGMGTTLCAMALVDTDDDARTFCVINIGDSRCYRWRDGLMTQITRDHSLVEDMRAAGQITEAEAAVHPHRNIVTRALGIQPDVKVDAFDVVPVAGDRYVLCSDGLFNEVSADRIGATLRRLEDPRDAASELVRQANEAGGRDNVTCVVVDVIDATGAVSVADAPVDSSDRPPDLAGITTALAVDEGPIESSDRSERSGKRRRAVDPDPADRPTVRLRRATWRTAGFVVLLAAVLGVAVAAVGWYARGSYFVGVDGDQVTVFKGRPGSVLWFDPTVEARTGITLEQVPATLRDAVVSGKQQSSRADADAYVARMRTVICTDLENGAKPATTVAGAPTSTLPSSCADGSGPSKGSTAPTSGVTGSKVPTTKRPSTTVRHTGTR